MNLTIDARKAFDTGIGTYIRQVVPRVIRRLPRLRTTVLIQRSTASQHAYLNGHAVDFLETDTRPFTLREQWWLRRFCGEQQLFWATSLAHPLYSDAVINTIHDVAQLGPPGMVGSLTQRWMGMPFFFSIRRASRLVLFNSTFTESEFYKHVGHPVGASAVTALGVDESWFAVDESTAQRPCEGPYFLMVGNLRPHKNLRSALKAMLLVCEAIPHALVVVGPDRAIDPSDSILRNLLLQLRGRVVFAGPLPQPALKSALRRAEALIFPSFYEGFGLPVLEAMASGCPTLVARNGISPTVAGPMAGSFDPADATELARLMVALVAMSNGERQRLVADGIDRAHTMSWDRTATATAAAIEGLLSRMPGRSGLRPAA